MSLADQLADVTALEPDSGSSTGPTDTSAAGTVALGTLWRERPVVLAFVRHFG